MARSTLGPHIRLLSRRIPAVSRPILGESEHNGVALRLQAQLAINDTNCAEFTNIQPRESCGFCPNLPVPSHF